MANKCVRLLLWLILNHFKKSAAVSSSAAAVMSGGPTISLSSDDSHSLLCASGGGGGGVSGGTPPLLHNVPLPLPANPPPSTSNLPNGPLLHCGAGPVVVTCTESGESSSASAVSSSVLPPPSSIVQDPLRMSSVLPRAPSPGQSSSSTTVCEADVHQEDGDKHSEDLYLTL